MSAATRFSTAPRRRRTRHGYGVLPPVAPGVHPRFRTPVTMLATGPSCVTRPDCFPACPMTPFRRASHQFLIEGSTPCRPMGSTRPLLIAAIDAGLPLTVLRYQFQIPCLPNNFPDERLEIPCSTSQGNPLQAFDFSCVLDSRDIPTGPDLKISQINSLFAGKCGPRQVRSGLLRQPGSPVSIAARFTVIRSWAHFLLEAVMGEAFAERPCGGRNPKFRCMGVPPGRVAVSCHNTSTHVRAFMRTWFHERLWSKVLERQALPFWRQVGRWLNRRYANAFPVTSSRR